MFIVFEGIDGSGKTTTAKIVTDMLVEMGVPAIYTYEPYFYKDIIKNYVHDYILATALFSADRIRHVKEVIKPALDKGEWVICDRYAESTWVYEYYCVLGADEEIVKNFIEATALIKPDVEFLFDIDPQIALTRKNGDMFENLTVLSNARFGYMESPLYAKRRYVIYADDLYDAVSKVLNTLKAEIKEAINV